MSRQRIFERPVGSMVMAGILILCEGLNKGINGKKSLKRVICASRIKQIITVQVVRGR